MITDYQVFQGLAEAMESIAVVITLLIGGLWTFFTFNVLALRNKAKMELLELEQKIKQEPVVEVSMSASCKRIPADDRIYLAIDVHVHNTGNKDANIILQEPPLTLGHVDISEKGEINLTSPLQHWRIYALQNIVFPLSKIKLRPGLEETFSFMVCVPKTGVYLLTFQIPVPPEYKEEKFQFDPWWGTSRFIVVN